MRVRQGLLLSLLALALQVWAPLTHSISAHLPAPSNQELPAHPSDEDADCELCASLAQARAALVAEEPFYLETDLNALPLRSACLPTYASANLLPGAGPRAPPLFS